ncbi:AMIN-like domain-containing (lipo)protein [Rhodococcus daqingensis]|uniref:AMIN-like domain-containing protein n=1 Tax=Rhodococcus daqingensis TaxID=2479363 RepID=A0ABW2S6B1_9NOCA
MNRPNSSRARIAALCGVLTVGGVLALTGCGDSDGVATTSGSVTAAPTDSPVITSTATLVATTPGAVWSTEPHRADASDDAHLTVAGLRVGAHDGYDRVVYELGGTGVPGWSVRYVDLAVQEGSGDVIPIAGETILEVLITGSGYPFDTGVHEYDGPNPLPGEDTELVTEARISGVFEGTTQSFIGLESGGHPFSVSTLSDPTRLVVDIAR